VEHCNETAEPFRAEYRLIARDGRTVWVQDESLVVSDRDGRPLFTQGYLLDITARKRSEQRLAAEHAVARVVAEATTLEEAAPRIVQVVCEALDWEAGAMWLFDSEPDALPCAAARGTLDGSLAAASWERQEPGDALLRQLGSRLPGCVRASDTVARLGGDEFGFVLTDVGTADTAALVERIQRALTDPFTIDQLSLQVEASLGIALYPEHGEDVDQLLQHGDVAMYVAKRNGAGCAFYDPEKDRYTPTRLSIVGGR
jgi:Diguanylate cyclase, GGDEF domain/PAS fold